VKRVVKVGKVGPEIPLATQDVPIPLPVAARAYVSPARTPSEGFMRTVGATLNARAATVALLLLPVYFMSTFPHFHNAFHFDDVHTIVLNPTFARSESSPGSLPTQLV